MQYNSIYETTIRNWRSHSHTILRHHVPYIYQRRYIGGSWLYGACEQRLRNEQLRFPVAYYHHGGRSWHLGSGRLRRTGTPQSPSRSDSYSR